MGFKELGFVIIMFFLSNGVLLAQNFDKENPILFMDVSYGSFGSKSPGFMVGAEIYYQHEKNLFSVAYTRLASIDISPVVAGFVAFPVFKNIQNVDEIAVLYGRRYIKSRHSYSFSAGPSYNSYSTVSTTEGDPWERTHGLGLTVEGNIKWFKREKKKMRLYFIPVGKPTSLGLNFGFKLSGNISRNPYAGISLVTGMGWHKNYEETAE